MPTFQLHAQYHIAISPGPNGVTEKRLRVISMGCDPIVVATQAMRAIESWTDITLSISVSTGGADLRKRYAASGIAVDQTVYAGCIANWAAPGYRSSDGGESHP